MSGFAQHRDSLHPSEQELRTEIQHLLRGTAHEDSLVIWYHDKLAYLRASDRPLFRTDVLVEDVSLLPLEDDSASGKEHFLLVLDTWWLRNTGAVEELRLQDTVALVKSERSTRVASLIRSDESIWSSVLQPILVAVGAAVVIALFFFVRS